MSDFLQAIADHLNRTPTMCRCGHPSVLHAARVGCTARWEHDSGSDVCPCEETETPTVNLTYLARGIQRIDIVAGARAAGGEGVG